MTLGANSSSNTRNKCESGRFGIISCKFRKKNGNWLFRNAKVSDLISFLLKCLIAHLALDIQKGIPVGCKILVQLFYVSPLYLNQLTATFPFEETGQLTCSAHQVNGFFMMERFIFNCSVLYKILSNCLERVYLNL